MKPTPASRDDFKPGPFGLWALGLAGATRSRWADEIVETAEGDDGVACERVGACVPARAVWENRGCGDAPIHLEHAVGGGG